MTNLNIRELIKAIESNYKCKITRLDVKYVDFFDTSLDLPEPGKFYNQVITSGAKVLANTMKGGQRLFHTSLDGKILKENSDTSEAPTDWDQHFGVL